MVQVGRCDRLKLIQRFEPPREDSDVSRTKLLGAVRDKIQVKIVARRVVEVDRADGHLGLARNHLDRRAFEPMPGENLGRRTEDSLSPRTPLPPMPFLHAHRLRIPSH